jgi:hypothetical protein
LDSWLYYCKKRLGILEVNFRTRDLWRSIFFALKFVCLLRVLPFRPHGQWEDFAIYLLTLHHSAVQPCSVLPCLTLRGLSPLSCIYAPGSRGFTIQLFQQHQTLFVNSLQSVFLDTGSQNSCKYKKTGVWWIILKCLRYRRMWSSGILCHVAFKTDVSDELMVSNQGEKNRRAR